jgi:hypothetical protein
VTDAAGHYRVEHLPPGPYEVRAIPPGMKNRPVPLESLATAQVELAAEEVFQQDLRFASAENKP